jgi:hypothetical protein
MLKDLFDGWKGATVASLTTALVLFALYGPQDHKYAVAGEGQGSDTLTFLFSPDMLLVYFTAALFGVGFLTYTTFNRQADIMADQIKLARDEFNATHRPILEVRFVRKSRRGVEITVINTGTASAVFVSAKAVLVHCPRESSLPSPHEIGGEAFQLRRRFQPSDSDRYDVPVSVNPGEAFKAVVDGPLHVFGWIVYDSETPTPVRRTTYFGRLLQPMTSDFVQVRGDDWNFIQ